MARSEGILCTSLLLAGCSQPAPDAEPRDPVGVEQARPPDLRPPVGHNVHGDDVTEVVRKQNEPGSEPPEPTQKGVVRPTALRPSVTRTDTGFTAAIPNSVRISTPALEGGRILTGGSGGREMYALDAQTGKSIWALHLSDDGPSDPACEGGVCVFNTYSCTTFAIEAATGRHLWSWWLGSPQLATTVIADGVVYASYPAQGKFVIGAFDLHTGKSRWQRWIDGEVNSTPVAHRGHIYLATSVGTLYEFVAKDGSVVSALRNRIATPPLLTDMGILFAGEEPPPSNELLRASRAIFPALEGGTVAATPIAPKPRPLVAQHRIVSVEPGGAVVAKNHHTGRPLWSADLDGAANIPAPLIFAGESILVATTNGNVLRVEPDSGVVMSSFELGRGPLASQPVAVDGWLYAGTMAGALVAYDTGDPELTGWPMLGGSPDRQGAAGD